MYTIISRDRLQLSAGTVVRMPGSWQDYRFLCQSRGDSSIPRIKYRQGEILLMSPMPKQGRDANNLADIVKVLLDAQSRNYEAFTPITMDLPEERGIEPDFCFYIDHWQAVLGKDRLEWESEPPPDLVIEVDVTSYSDVEDYLPYQVPEVWLFKQDRLWIYSLQGGSYELQGSSRFFPGVEVAEVVADCLRVAAQKGTGVAMRELRDRLT